MEGSRLTEEEDITSVNAVLAAIVARSVGSPEQTRSKVEASISAAAAGDFGLSAEDIHVVARKLPPEHSAIIVLFENVWERKLKAVAHKHGGALVNQRLITSEALAKVASELTAASELQSTQPGFRVRPTEFQPCPRRASNEHFQGSEYRRADTDHKRGNRTACRHVQRHAR